jgi:hypothetical protein
MTMTSQLIPHISMSNHSDEPYARLLKDLEPHANNQLKINRDFYAIVARITQSPPGSQKREREKDMLVEFMKKLPLWSPRKKFPNLSQIDKEEYESLRVMKIAEAISRMPNEFHPIGDSPALMLTGWINRKLRLKYEFLDFMEKRIQSQDSKIWKEFCDKPTRNVLDDIIRRDQEEEKAISDAKWREYINDDPDDSLRSKYASKHPDCNYQYLAQELFLKKPPSTKAAIAKKFKIDYNAFNADLNRHFLGKMLSLRLKLLSPEMIETLKTCIEADNTKLTNSSYKNAPDLTVKFMAVRLLEMFRNPPMTFADIQQEPELSSYEKLTDKKLKRFWEENCLAKLIKLVERELVY